MLCKPLIPRECEFYQTIYRDFPPLIPLTPEFHGSITIHNQKATTDTHSDYFTIYRNPSPVNNYLKISNTDSALSTSSINTSAYIVLEDLTAGMSKPCAMDMKVCTFVAIVPDCLWFCTLRFFFWFVFGFFVCLFAFVLFFLLFDFLLVLFLVLCFMFC